MQSRLPSLVLLIVFCLLATESHSQTSATVDDQLRKEYTGKTLLLRGFYSGKKLRFDENGAVLDGSVAGPWTLAFVKVADILTTPHEIQIKGERQAYWFRGGNNLVGVGSAKITILRPAVDPDALATARLLMKRVFLQSGEQFCPMLPQYWQVFCAGEDAQAQKAAWMKILETNHLSPYDPHEPTPASAPAAKVTPPHVDFTTTADPSYTKEAVLNKVEGRSVLRLVVDEKGQPTVITILRPLGMGLDEEFIKAVSQWKFRPGMRDGKPVQVQIEGTTNFRCCPY